MYPYIALNYAMPFGNYKILIGDELNSKNVTVNMDSFNLLLETIACYWICAFNFFASYKFRKTIYFN
jgi:hypothetical protein